MKTKLLLLTLLFSTVIFCHGKICRVGYTGAAIPNADFPDFGTAQNNCVNGDTIQIYGAIAPINVSKSLVIMGFGYNLDVHPNLNILNQMNVNQQYLNLNTNIPSKIFAYNISQPANWYPQNQLNFSSGSENSIIVGLTIDRIWLIASNITFTRCFIDQVYFINSNNTKFISSAIQYASNEYSGAIINTQFFNCILRNTFFFNNVSTILISNCVTPSYSSTLYFNDANVSVKNSIISYYSTNNINSIYTNTIFKQSIPNPLPYGTNIHWNESWNNIFDRLNGNSDDPSFPDNGAFDENYYILKSGSPAINAGIDAFNNPTDCGIFGGELAYKYVISGVPPVPAIYQLTAPGPATITNPYNISISVKSHN